ncbi:MAG: hypothetical protein CSB55_04060 [Candidatus Cloacimonadota bacterium]|nr:MAG: hypothetical protein CSB55_04060 [Candidatus Cloacimonadota bacterium]
MKKNIFAIAFIFCAVSVFSQNNWIKRNTFDSVIEGQLLKPAFTDLDDDGLTDLLTGDFNGHIKHYEQQADSSTEFELITEDLLQSDIDIYNSAPTIIDLDNDEKLDLIIGKKDGKLLHYEQIEKNSTEFDYVTDNFNGIDVGTYSSPVFTDLNGDGILDLFVGEYNGNINRYMQNGANSNVFTLQTAVFGNINNGFYSAPAFTDLDNDGRLDLLIGEYSGKIYHYRQNSVNSSDFTLVNPKFNDIDVGEYSSPSFIDFDNDDNYDMVIGKADGALLHYEEVKEAINPGDLIITEVRSSNTSSYAELYNNTDRELYLDNIVLKSFNNGYSEPNEINLSGILGVREYYLVIRNSYYFNLDYGNAEYDLIFSTLNADGGKDALALVYNGTVIDRFNKEGNEATSYPAGTHFERVDFLSSGESLENDWEDAETEHTPGTINESDNKTATILNPNDNFNFGYNGQGNPAMVLTVNGENLPGETSVTVNRGRDVADSGEKLFVRRYFEINSENQEVDYSLKIYYKDSELNGLDENNLIIVGYRDGEWHEFNDVTRDTTENRIQAAGLNYCSIWGLREEESTSLPVKFSTFSLAQSGEDAIIKWITQTENDMRGFYVLKSEAESLESADKISDLIPASNTPFAHEYVYEDKSLESGKHYWYRIEAVSLSNNSFFTESQSILLAEENEPDEDAPDAESVTCIKDVYPNPFNPPVKISFYIDEKTAGRNAGVSIEIYNVRGQKVYSKDLGNRNEGLHTIKWNGKNENGRECGNGIYFIKLIAGYRNFLKKSIKLK